MRIKTIRDRDPTFFSPISNPAILWTMSHCDTGRARWDYFFVGLALGLSYSGGGKPFLTWVMRRAISIDDENAWGGIFIKIIFIKVSLCLCITNQPSNKGYPDFKFLYESGFWPVLNLINEEGCWNNRMVSPWNGPTEMIIYVSP